MDELVLQAPEALDAQTRAAFQQQAVGGLDALRSAPPGSRLVIDLSATRGIDSAGLSALLLVQLRAAERRITVVLRGAPEQVRFLLLMTGLEDRFHIEAAPGADPS